MESNIYKTVDGRCRGPPISHIIVRTLGNLHVMFYTFSMCLSRNTKWFANIYIAMSRWLLQISDLNWMWLVFELGNLSGISSWIFRLERLNIWRRDQFCAVGGDQAMGKAIHALVSECASVLNRLSFVG